MPLSDQLTTGNERFPLQYLKGVGPKRAAALASEGIRTPADVLALVPRGYIDRTAVGSLAQLQQRIRSHNVLLQGNAEELADVTQEVSVVVTISAIEEKRIGRNRRMLVARITDRSGATARLIFWNAIGYFSSVLAVGASYMVSGTPEYDQRWNTLTFTHPDLEKLDADDADNIAQGAVLARYPLSQKLRASGISMRLLRSVVDHVLRETLHDIPEVLPDALLAKRKLLPKAEAVKLLHQPTSLAEAEEARRRLTYEELFYFQLSLAQRRTRLRIPEKGITIRPKSERARTLLKKLPYSLTPAQRRVIHEIMADMEHGTPMHRLLQGDVGSGKTIVALLCMLSVVDNGYQTVIMAPTELLADQHYRNITRLLTDANVVVEQLVGAQNKRTRRDVLERIAEGSVNIIVGTHALFEAAVEYQRLGLIVIDEQHRFGVAQRAQLQHLARRSHEGGNIVPHVLVMSATPIPRTLAMSVYGDLDVSVIDQLPSQRKPIVTKVVFESELQQAYLFLHSQVQEGRQAYIVYPLVEKSEKLQLKSAVEHFEMLKTQVFPSLRLGLLHGQMLPQEKDDVMREFERGNLDIVVATTVVEVGVDVSNATVMLIENAERFGLAQLHQLRGRVGRGHHQSYCLLATKDHFQYHLKGMDSATERAKSAVRLRTMEETTNGFRIAEVDLQLRGPGDVLGTRQSGLPEFTYANIVTDADILADARADAFELIETDPQITFPHHTFVRQHLDSLSVQGVFQNVA